MALTNIVKRLALAAGVAAAGCSNNIEEMNYMPPSHVSDAGQPPKPRIFEDMDRDGFKSVEYGGGDCNDTDPEINPDVLDIADGIDNNCANGVDEFGDGKIYMKDRDEQGRILFEILDLSTGMKRPIFADEASLFRGGDLSPDGSRIAYSSDGIIRILELSTKRTETVIRGDHITDPSWFPGNRDIAVNYSYTPGEQPLRASIKHIINADPNRIITLFESMPRHSIAGVRISPGANKVAFTMRDDTNPDDVMKLYVVNTAGNNLIQLTDDPSYWPIWGKDDRIFYTGVDGVYSVNPDGSGQRLEFSDCESFHDVLGINPQKTQLLYKSSCSIRGEGVPNWRNVETGESGIIPGLTGYVVGWDD